MYPYISSQRRSFSVVGIVLAGCALLVVLLGQGAPALAFETNSASQPATCGTWNVVAVPDLGSYSNGLYGVAAISSNDAWAVGEQYDYGLSSYRGMVEHWNGTAWSAGPGSAYAISLRGVAAIASNDVWAVGWMGGYGFSPFTEHWDGSQWTYVQASVSGGRRLYGVAAVSTNDVWAVGQSSSQGVTGILILHWNGTQWLSSPAPSIPTGILYGVTAVAANDVWAVGTVDNGATVTLHWDGTQWTRITSPNRGAFINVLTSVSAISSSDIWGVGYWATSGVEYHGYTLHWDGTQWNAVTNPTNDPVPAGNYLYGVSAAPNGEVWAVGRNLRTAGSTGMTLHLQNGIWTIVPNPNPGYANTNLYGVTTSGMGGTWAVGNYDTSQYGYTYPLIERYTDATCATPTSVPSTSTPASTATSVATGTTPTVTVIMPTNTQVVPSHTTVPSTSTPAQATATLIACQIEFTDVLPGSTFYTYIRCMACQGIISGYSDSTFRPNAAVTRGQLSKIVANAAGFSDMVSSQSFEDVPMNSTFYIYIERMSQNGIISGYQCGGAGEPCGSENKPYFRPGANATRGQISKIVANAAGLQDIMTTQTFEDVPTTHPFYQWIERLGAHGMMGGYSCGGAGEPCDAERRSYFRAQNNATRGQVAKIVSNALSPNCTP